MNQSTCICVCHWSNKQIVPPQTWPLVEILLVFIDKINCYVRSVAMLVNRWLITGDSNKQIKGGMFHIY